MEIILKCTIPDEDVATAQANGPGNTGDLVDWIVDHFQWESRSYFTNDLDFRFTIEVEDIR